MRNCLSVPPDWSRLGTSPRKAELRRWVSVTTRLLSASLFDNQATFANRPWPEHSATPDIAMEEAERDEL